MYRLLLPPVRSRERTVEVTFEGPAQGVRVHVRVVHRIVYLSDIDTSLRPVRFGVSYNKHGRPKMRPCEGERELRRRIAGLAMLGLAFALPEAASAKSTATAAAPPKVLVVRAPRTR